MERVAFIVEETGERITCMLNPEHIVQRSAVAGLAPRRTGAGIVAGPARSDSPLLHTGGGRTELDLQLLFDVDLAADRPAARRLRPPDGRRADRAGARAATRALTRTAASPRPAGTGRAARPRGTSATTRGRCGSWPRTPRGGRGVPHVRVVLGKEWNMLAVVEASPSGSNGSTRAARPGRSWLTMRLVRVPDPNPPAPETPAPVTISGCRGRRGRRRQRPPRSTRSSVRVPAARGPGGRRRDAARDRRPLTSTVARRCGAGSPTSTCSTTSSGPSRAATSSSRPLPRTCRREGRHDGCRRRRAATAPRPGCDPAHRR